MSRRRPQQGVDPSQFGHHVIRIVCTGRGDHDRTLLWTISRRRAQPTDIGDLPIMARDERESRARHAEHQRRGQRPRTPLHEYGERPTPDRLDCVCPRCARNRPMRTDAGSPLAELFHALDDGTNALPLDTAGWAASARSATYGPRVFDISALG